ncbi:SusC/RagA family TonB-linked outer membrane protein [Seramator thermalis]|uniref:SusC/RagA family TonB-linked outer membrane protein n=1 Tax=Seramator thermalis TaxID=2496270 RepID=UPI00101D6EC7|nr:SusC/RagA family TonB-linked outer membrane protein [Seramator thermalis]
MNKNNSSGNLLIKKIPINHFLLIMRTTIFLLFTCVFCSMAELSYTQNARVTINKRNATIKEILNEIEKQTDYLFIYNDEVNANEKVSVKAKQEAVSSVLNSMLKDKDIKYSMEGNHIILSTNKNESPENQIEANTQQQQKKRISGTVLDENGQPIIGANIIEVGTTNGTVTDMDGKFTLDVSDNATIRISYIGYLEQEVNTSGKNTLNITLVEDTQTLEEVVVVGYGTQKKINLTGSISSVRTENIQTATHSSLAQKLQGKVAGLNIRQNSGQPGQFDNNIQIRGFGNPLYVIDGVIRNDAGAFQKLNPEDIESISVLKDASAAIYGIGAANGVIIVTTNQGTKGKTTFNYSAVVGTSAITDRVRQATAAEYTMMLNEAALYSNPGRISSPAFEREELQKWQDGTLPGYEGTDWWKLTMKDFSTQTQHNLSANGGNENVTYYIGLEYVKDNGMLQSGDLGYDRANLRSNVTANLTKDLRVRVNIAGLYDKAYQPGESFQQIARNTIVTLPTEYPYANNNPLYPATTNLGVTPLAASQRELTGFNENENRNLQSSLELKYTVPFLKNLVITGLGSYDQGTYLNKNLYKAFYTYTYNAETDTYNPIFRRPDQNLYNQSTVNNTYMLRIGADYNIVIGADHDVKLMLVAEQYKGWLRGLEGRRYYGDFFTNDQLRFANEANQTTNGWEDQNARISYIGRLNYAFAQKYLIDFAFNYNGSYRYHPDNRFGFFPVVSGAWRISEENFLKNNDVISNLKLRASYGVLGTDAGNPFQYLPGFTFGGPSFWEFTNGTQLNGLQSPALTNNLLSWLTNETTDIGFDLSLWNGKLDVTFDVYNREQKGLLATRAVSLPNTFGTTLPQENLNSNRQTGFDLELGHRNNINGFNYEIRGNMNWARTMIRHRERGPFQSQYDRWLSNDAPNRWTNFVRGYQTDGQFTSFEEINNSPLQQFQSIRELPGDYRFKDRNNDGIINNNDGVVPYKFGATPLLNFGLMLNLNWKGFDAAILFQGASGYTVRYTETLAEWFWFSGSLPAYFMDRWHQADPYDINSEWIPGKWPAPRPNATQTMQKEVESDLWRRDATYVRLKNLEIGYTFKPEILELIKVQRLRVYTNAFNLLTWTKDPLVKKLDPEKTAGPGTATYGHNYPLTKNFNIGLNVTF